MRPLVRWLVGFLLGVGLFLITSEEALATLKEGGTLPAFQLLSLTGERFSDKNFTDSKLGVIYLFKHKKCPTCSDGLTQLKEVKQRFGRDLTIVAIGKGNKTLLASWVAGMGLNFPLLSGDRAFFKSLSTSVLFPTTLLVGPDNRLLKVIQARRGNYLSEMLSALAEIQLQRNQTASSEELYVRASKEENSVVAQAGAAYSQLKRGAYRAAGVRFQEMATSADKRLALHGKEGLAEMLFQGGKEEEALKVANQVLIQAPNRVMANLVKGKVLYAKGKKQGAARALQQASSSSDDSFSWQKAEVDLAQGNLQMENKQSKIALKSYQQAAHNNPYLAEVWSNQGVALKEMGAPEEALTVLNKLQKIHPSDRLVDVLLRQTHAAIAQKQDLEHQKYIDSMVKELVSRFKEQKKQTKGRDTWTSPMGAVSVLGFKNNASKLMGRIGLEGILKDELARALGEHHVSVVEREILDKVMVELKLGSSALANPKSQIKLGKMTAAHILAVGSFYDMERGSVATMRLVETETTDIFLSLSAKSKTALDPSALAMDWAVEISAKIREHFPLQGRIVVIKPKQVIINLGSRHAVRKGMLFNVLSEGEAIDLGDGEVVYDYEPVGQVRVQRVKEKIAFAKIISQKGTWEKKQKVTVSH